MIQIVKAIFFLLANFMMLGGFYTFIILVFWITGITLSFKKMRQLKKLDTHGSLFFEEIQRLLLNGNIHEALIFCSDKTISLARVLKVGLKKINKKQDYINHSMQITILEEKSKIERNLNYLLLILILLILFGILGTANGIVESFMLHAKAGQINQIDKSKLFFISLSYAMNSLIFGLFSSTTILIFYSLLRIKANKILEELKEFSTKFIHFVSFDHCDSENVKE